MNKAKKAQLLNLGFRLPIENNRQANNVAWWLINGRINIELYERVKIEKLNIKENEKPR